MEQEIRNCDWEKKVIVTIKYTFVENIGGNIYKNWKLKLKN